GARAGAAAVAPDVALGSTTFSTSSRVTRISGSLFCAIGFSFGRLRRFGPLLSWLQRTLPGFAHSSHLFFNQHTLHELARSVFGGTPRHQIASMKREPQR